MLDLDKSSGDYRMNAYRIAEGFVHPIDAGLYRTKLYLVEYGVQYGRDPRPLGIFEVTLPSEAGNDVQTPPSMAWLRATAHPDPLHTHATVTHTLNRPDVQ